MDVSVIIVNYNTLHVLLPCLDSIMEHTGGISFEIIVVDNGSTDGSAETLSKDERIRFVQAGSNLGFGKANNLGLTLARGEYIFFLNSDTLLGNNAIGIMLGFARQYKGYVSSSQGVCVIIRHGGRIFRVIQAGCVRIAYPFSPLLIHLRIGPAQQVISGQ